MRLGTVQGILDDQAATPVLITPAQPYITAKREEQRRGRRGRHTEYLVGFEGYPISEAVWCAPSMSQLLLQAQP